MEPPGRPFNGRRPMERLCPPEGRPVSRSRQESLAGSVWNQPELGENSYVKFEVKLRRRRRRRRRSLTNSISKEATLNTPTNKFTTSQLSTIAEGTTIRFMQIFYLLTLLSIAASDNSDDLFRQQPAYHEEPQALFLSAYNLEAGSGNGYANSPNQLQPSSFSSSVSPSLIMAKCWNNYENDNDCKDLNFITAEDNRRPEGSRKQQEDDDSLITPVIVFESSTPLQEGLEEQRGSSENFLLPPFFSSTPFPVAEVPAGYTPRTYKPLANNQNDDVYSPPPANATVRLPATSTGGDYSNIPPYGASSSSTPRPEAVVTGRPKSIFVATPAPKKPPKTTTMGRKCLDENDADCDEPEESNNINREDDNEDKDDESGRGVDDDDDDDETAKSTNSRKSSPESGSGEGPIDDNEEAGDDGDDDTENQLEGSGGSDTSSFMPPDKNLGQQTSTASSRFVQIISTTSVRPTEKGPEAVIDIVLHSTLPPSFRMTTPTGSSSLSEEGEDQKEAVTRASTPAPITTTPSDDLYKSKPVFPPTIPEAAEPGSELGGEFDNETASEFPSSGLRLDTTSTTTTERIDLATFKPIPMPTVMPTSRQANQSEEEAPGPDRIANKHKLNTNAHQATLENPWREKPVAVRNPNQLQQHQQPQDWPRSKTLEQRFGDPASILKERETTRANSELLSKLFVYAVTIIVSIAIIMSVIVFMILRQRRRMMAFKPTLASHQQQQLLLNGAGNGFCPPPQQQQQQQQMVASMSHGNQLMNKVQQPSLLDTYAPGKGVSLAPKITSKRNQEEEQQGDMEELEGELNGSLDEEQQERKRTAMRENTKSDKLIATGRQLIGQTSWSTEEQTTSGSGSQKTNDSRQQIEPDVRRQQNTANGRQYANSLSDGRQNSSSISDSISPETGSQAAGVNNPVYPPPGPNQPIHDQNQQQQHLIQQMNQSPFNNNHSGAPQHQANMFNGQAQQFPVPQPAPLFQPNDGYGMMKPNFINRFPIEQGPAPYMDHKPGTPVHMNGFSNSFQMNPRQPFQGPLPNQSLHNQASLDAQFQRPINPARIALNPLATMSRRPAGSLLNRTIYSEDSSSFITASPSLARTSSSSSFAFTNNNGSQLNTPIRAKPFIDPATGRLFNDYTQPDGTPPALKRKSDFGEPWYV